jgi:hypothetical protein
MATFPVQISNITLPDRKSDEGVEARVLLAECRSPARKDTFSMQLAGEAMQLMDAVLWNRMEDPKPFGAKGAKSLADIVRAKGQFAGFEKYPDYDISIRVRIQEAIDIANNPKDARHALYAEFVNKAIETAKSTDFSDPSPGQLVAWRTSKHGSPGGNLLFFKSVLGNDFFYRPKPR